MRGGGTLRRATAGAAALLLIATVGWFATRLALGAFADDYRVSVVVGESGQGLISGSDVVMRGVIVGEVGRISLTEDLQAQLELVLEPQYAIPQRSTFAITGKTLLGEKQLEVRFDGDAEQGPLLAEGALVDDADRIVELQDVLIELEALLGAINEDDLAVVISDGLGAFDGQAELIARSVDQGSRAADVGARSLDDQIPSIADLALVAGELALRGEEFDRLAAESVRSLDTLTDNQEPLRLLLDTLVDFAQTLDATLEVDRPNLDRLIVEGDNVTRMLFAYAPEVGESVRLVIEYTRKFDSAFTHPTIEGNVAPFQILLTDPTGQLCAELPAELAALLPPCQEAGAAPAPAPGAPAGPQAPDLPLLSVPAPPAATAPQAPASAGLEALLGRTLEGLELGAADGVIPALPAVGG